MALFSERYGYTKPSEVFIRERITPELQIMICNCFDKLENDLLFCSSLQFSYYQNICKYLWINFLNKRCSEYQENNLIINYIEDHTNTWFDKLNLIELSINNLYTLANNDTYINKIASNFINDLNEGFKRLNFAYRVIDKNVVEITSDEEITAIETALKNGKDNIRTHLSDALKLYAQRPIADYRNSIKESISAVEAASRSITGKKVLHFDMMKKKGIVIHPVLQDAFLKLYGYTNDGATGIRHALMDDTNPPKAEEALFMLVSCCAFINYLNNKTECTKPA